MSNATTLKILQYNIRKGKDRTMVSLLEDPRIQDYDILAIQKPWRNTYVPTSYNPNNSGFHLAFSPEKDTRVCLYINNRIDPETWKVEFPFPDLCTLTISVCHNGERQTLHIHNVYNPSPTSYASTNSPSTLPTLQMQLKENGGHIVLGDFNLHHPYWSGPSRFTQHAVADTLIDMVTQAKLQLTLPRGTTTWEARGTRSTIDLVFMEDWLAQAVEHCRAAPELDQSSDHISISTALHIGGEGEAPVPRRAWKSLDQDEFRKELKSWCLTREELMSRESIDHYAKSMVQAIQQTIERVVPWARPSTKANAYWTPECKEAVTTARRLRRAWQTSREDADQRLYLSASDWKSKIIRKVKRTQF